MAEHKIVSVTFASIYPLYIKKIERKNRTKMELDEAMTWLTGYSDSQIAELINSDVTLREFFDQAPRMHPNAAKISGVICGVRVEEIRDPLMQKIR
jgi:hypothetical protein